MSGGGGGLGGSGNGSAMFRLPHSPLSTSLTHTLAALHNHLAPATFPPLTLPPHPTQATSSLLATPTTGEAPANESGETGVGDKWMGRGRDRKVSGGSDLSGGSKEAGGEGRGVGLEGKEAETRSSGCTESIQPRVADVVWLVI